METLRGIRIGLVALALTVGGCGGGSGGPGASCAPVGSACGTEQCCAGYVCTSQVCTTPGNPGTPTCVHALTCADGKNIEACSTANSTYYETPDGTKIQCAAKTNCTAAAKAAVAWCTANGGGGMSNLPIGYPCSAAGECASKQCIGWCTAPCASDDACGMYAWCVLNQGQAYTCFPNCDTNADCAGYGAGVICKMNVTTRNAVGNICSK